LVRPIEEHSGLSYPSLSLLCSCVLVTFYFTQELLPSIAVSGEGVDAASARTDEAVQFVKIYGAYLRLHLCLVCAAMLKAHSVIEELLALSKYDPRHREVTKELSKASSLVLYDPVRWFVYASLQSSCSPLPPNL